MFLKTIRSEGLAHLSYLLVHKGKAVVIDPRRDCRVYIDEARLKGARISHIFETHRNEDYVVGSRDLARLTGAEIYHGKNFDFQYGNPVSEGDIFEIGDLKLKILETPGHTFESISLALYDLSFGEDAVGVFTGDTLFVGDVGRTDFFPDQLEEAAGLLHDSIYNKLAPLGPQAIIYPAHGAGSVCGDAMAEREFSTLGYELKYNHALRNKERASFISRKVNEQHDHPPYFKEMERLNGDGSAPPLGMLPYAIPLQAHEFESRMKKGALILDTRSPEAIGGALIPGSLGIPLAMIPAFAGWFLPYRKDILLVLHNVHEAESVTRYLIRMGYDRIVGFLEEGLFAWETSGRKYQTILSLHAAELTRKINEKEPFTLLDVRKESEVAQGRLPESLHIYLGDLPKRIDEIPKERPVVTFCGSGLRAVIAATILKQHGFDDVENALGSMAACAAVGCPIIK
ncbi:MAG: MBL fold metallo-hydrolase [Deltaproteobacteria bacterium]|nr:MBL fold metallo-hydrolase [Deltaproteobacteria bacterium]